MTELTPGDVETFTGGRLLAANGETQRMLDAALAVARREVGWHVSPVTSPAVTLTLDGPDSRVLWLPTLKLVTLTGVTEDGDTLTPTTDVKPSVGDGSLHHRRVSLRKTSRSYWTSEYGGITVTMTHGFTEAEAADWRQAILSMVDQISLLPVSAASGSSEFGMAAKRIDDIQLNWSNPYAAMAEEVLFSFSGILCEYKLYDVEYV